MPIFPHTLRPAEIAAEDLSGHVADTGNPHEVTAGQAAAVPAATYDAHSILAAVSDNTPVAVTVAEQRVVGRVTAGDIDDLTGAQVGAMIALGDLSDVDGDTPDSGDVLTWDGDSWTPAAPVSGDAAAIHDDVSGEIAAVAEKTTPIAADLLLIEDSAATNAKKRIQIGNLPRALPGPCIFSWTGDNTGAHRSTTSAVTIGNLPWRPSTYDAVWTHVRFVMLLSATAAGAEPVNVNLIRTQLFGGSEGSGTELAISSTSSIAGGTSAWSIVTALVARSSLSESDRHYSIQLARGGASGSALGLSFAAFLTTAAG